MGIGHRIVQWFRRRRHGNLRVVRLGEGEKKEAFTCSHGAAKRPFKVLVFGAEIMLDKAPMCEACAGEYLNRYATLCGSCEKVIFPGEPVGQAYIGAPYPLTHLTMECCPSGALYCGKWGEGRLITLHELDPEQFPEGAASAMSHVMSTGRIIATHVD